MKKLFFFLFLSLGTLAFAQLGHLKNFNNQNNFTVNGKCLYMFTGPENTMTEDDSEMVIQFTKGKFTILGYDFQIEAYDFYVDENNEKVLEIIGVWPNTDVEVYLYFTYEKSDGMFMLNDETNTSFFFIY